MLERTKRVSLRSSVSCKVCKVEPEPDLVTGFVSGEKWSGSDQNGLAPTGFGSATLVGN